MTNQKIDFRLALAIGWQKNQMNRDMSGNVFLLRDGIGGEYWRLFDHTDPAVIWRIAERFKAFPIDQPGTEWLAIVGSTGRATYHAVAATATALAVIEHCKKGQP